MASIIGNAVVIIALGVIIFFSGRSTIRQLKREASGGGCSCCSGGCSGCAATGAEKCSCGSHKE